MPKLRLLAALLTVVAASPVLAAKDPAATLVRNAVRLNRETPHGKRFRAGIMVPSGPGGKQFLSVQVDYSHGSRPLLAVADPWGGPGMAALVGGRTGTPDGPIQRLSPRDAISAVKSVLAAHGAVLPTDAGALLIRDFRAQAARP